MIVFALLLFRVLVTPDHNVPNALNFIDKYNQVARILGPISITLGNIERLYKEDGGIRDFIDTGGCPIP